MRNLSNLRQKMLPRRAIFILSSTNVKYMLTCLVANRPDQQIHTGGVGHYVHLEAIDSTEIRINVLAFTRVVLSRLQLRLAREEQTFDEFLHIPRERGR